MRSLWPLPLEPWELSMWRDDRPRYPMTFQIRWEISGTIRREPFEQAVRTALERHPLLNCLVARIPWRGPCWVPQSVVGFTVDWAESDVPLMGSDGREEFLDLSHETGLRIWVRPAFQRATLTFQFHHAATDGLGAIQFLGDLLAVYGQLTADTVGEAPELVPLEIERLARRGDCDRGRVETWRQWLADGALYFDETWRLFTQRAVRLARRNSGAAAFVRDIDFPAILTRKLPRRESQALREAAARYGVSPNDLYLREMFLTLRDWNRDCGDWSPRARLRIGMPLSMRTAEHDRMPAANVVSCFFVARQLADGEDFDNRLLADLHRQTDRIVNHRLGWYLLNGMKWASRVPGAVSFAVSERHRFATCLLANVADIRRQMSARFPLRRGKLVAGNIVLESFEGAAPVRPNTHAGVSLGTYAGELIVNLHPDPWHFSKAEADELLDRFVARLRRQAVVTATVTTDHGDERQRAEIEHA